MAIEDITPIDPFSNAPHGTQVKDDLAPASAAGEAVFVGYPDCVTIEAAAATVISASSDIEITDGKPVEAAGATYIELGTVGATGFLRLKRVRYALLKGTAAFTVHQHELNVITTPAATLGLDD